MQYSIIDYSHHAVLFISYLFYNWKFVPFNALHLFCPSPHLSPLWQPSVCSLYLWVCFCFVLFSKIYLFIYFRERAQGAGAERQGEKVSSRLCAEYGAQLGLDLAILRSWSELKPRVTQLTAPPRHPCFVLFVHLFWFLDSTYRWNCMAFVLFFLISWSLIPSRSIHVVSNDNISFFFMAE